MSFGYDEEAIYQDADIDLEAKGICTHQGIRASKNKRDLRVCTGCGETFRDRDAWDAARKAVLG